MRFSLVALLLFAPVLSSNAQDTKTRIAVDSPRSEPWKKHVVVPKAENMINSAVASDFDDDGAIDILTSYDGGVVLLFAPTVDGATIPVSINSLFWRRDVTLTTTYAGSPSDCVRALELIRAQRVQVRDMITHHFGLSEADKGFQLVADGDASIKVIIRPQE